MNPGRAPRNASEMNLTRHQRIEFAAMQRVRQTGQDICVMREEAK